MASDKIDKWVEKNPASWAKIAKNLKQKESFDSFKKKFKMGAKENGKYNAIKHMTNEQINAIYKASGSASTSKTQTTDVKEFGAKAFKPRVIQVKRKGKTYSRKVGSKWGASNNLSLKIAADAKPGSDEYKRYVASIVKATGRSRQAVVKKIQRTRKQNKK
jgi:hypothetical protein